MGFVMFIKTVWAVLVKEKSIVGFVAFVVLVGAALGFAGSDFDRGLIVAVGLVSAFVGRRLIP